MEPSQDQPTHPLPSIFNLFTSFLRLGTTAFGGPAMVAYIRRLAVEQKHWVDDSSSRYGVALCQVIPGATAIQMAAYVGFRARGVSGAAATFIGFGLPAFLLMMGLSIAYQYTHTLPVVISTFNGLQAIIVAVVANATLSFGRTSIKNWKTVLIALIAVALFGWKINPIGVIFFAAVLGVIFFARKPEDQKIIPSPEKMEPDGQSPRYPHYIPSYAKASEGYPPSAKSAEAAILQLMNNSCPTTHSSTGKARGLLRRRINSTGTVLLLLAAATVGIGLLYSLDRKLFDLALLMIRIDLFAFGGGFASVPLMFHEVVEVRSWLDGPTLLNGIVLGQVTPGPIVITATFVGYLLKGLLGGLIATISVFLPSFLIVVGMVPYFDRLRRSPYFNSVVNGILCSFVGLLLAVTIRFALNIQWDLIRIFLSLATFAALISKIDILWVVLIGTGISIALL